MDQPAARSFHELGRLPVAELPLPDMLRRVCSIALDAIEGAAMVGLTLDVGGHASSAAFTDEDVPEIDQVQNKTGVGPCVDSARFGQVFSIPSTPNDDRWKDFSAACVEHGVLSTLSAPVISRSAKRAALNFYARAEGAFSAEDVDLVAAIAVQAATAIENAEAYWSVRQLADQLSEALQSRIVIEQAKGLLMSEGRSSFSAFELLKMRSQTSNRKLRDIAAELVDESERRATEPSRGSAPGTGKGLAGS